jgi:hypothetical protein
MDRAEVTRGMGRGSVEIVLEKGPSEAKESSEELECNDDMELEEISLCKRSQGSCNRPHRERMVAQGKWGVGS